VAALALIAPVGGDLPRDALRGRPALAVAAENDHLGTPDDVVRTLTAMGGGRVETLAGADHYLHGHAEAVAAIVAGFFDAALPGRRDVGPGGL